MPDPSLRTVRYKHCLTDCIAKGKAGKADKEEEKVEDTTVKPTKAIGAYFYFSGEKIPQLKAEKGISHKEAMVESGKIWNEMSDEAKKPYTKKNEADKVR